MPGKKKLTSIERWILSRLMRRLRGVPVRIILWNGEPFCPSNDSPAASVLIRNRKTLIGLMRSPGTQFGEAYSSGQIDVKGNLTDLLQGIFQKMDGGPCRKLTGQDSGLPSLIRRNATSFGFWDRLRSCRLVRMNANTLRASRDNIHHHYDIGNDFYKLWLDSQLVYTCAYFPSSPSTLEEAQRAKMEYICRKVKLQPGETVVEAGCGWGALALHMARRYGVSVKAFNISREQISYARQRAHDEGLSHRVEFIQDDYRNISGRFDVFVSVGMLEHAGLEHYGEMGEVIHRSLGASGRGLLHFIGRDRESPLNAWTRKRIFPGAYPPTLRQALNLLEPRDFSVLDVENLRLHYARTLEHWLERFEKSADLVSKMFDAEFVRAWRLYLSGSLVAFRTGWLQLFQITFSRTACNQIPWTRAHLYPEAALDSSVLSAGRNSAGCNPRKFADRTFSRKLVAEEL